MTPKTGHEPYAVVQLRRDNAEGSIYNLVGFRRICAFRSAPMTGLLDTASSGRP